MMEKNTDINEQEYRAKFAQAIEIWNDAMGLDIRITDKSEADIIVYICTEEWFENITIKVNNEEGSVINGRAYMKSYVEVYRLYSYDENLTSSNNSIIEFREVLIGIFPTTDSSNLLHVMVHELGHALGYWEHAPNLTDVMYETGYGYNNPTIPSSKEIEFLKQIYRENTLC